MHLIVVRRDMSGFQHLHPRLGADGRWTTPLTIPEAGSYRVFADFKAGGKNRTLAPTSRCRARRLGAATRARRPRADRGRLRRSSARRAGARRACGRARVHDHSRRQAGRGRALPRRGRPSRRAAPGRPRVPPRPPGCGPPLTDHLHDRSSRPPAPTACSCSSRMAARCTRRRSRNGSRGEQVSRFSCRRGCREGPPPPGGGGPEAESRS